MRHAIMLAFAVVVAVVLVLYLRDPYPPPKLIDWIRHYPVFAPLIFVIVASVTTIVLLPFGLPLNLAAGLMWGGLIGGALTWFAASLSAAVAFALSRRYGEGVVQQLSARPTVGGLFEAVEEHDVMFIVLSRINPIVPFGIVSYLFGLTRIGFRRYLVASMIANAPGALLCAYMGESIGDVALTQDTVLRMRAAGVLLALATVALLLRYAVPRIRRRGCGRDA